MVTRRFIGQFSLTDPRSVFFLKSHGKFTIWCQIPWVQLTLWPWTSQVFQRSQWYTFSSECMCWTMFLNNCPWVRISRQNDTTIFNIFTTKPSVLVSSAIKVSLPEWSTAPARRRRSMRAVDVVLRAVDLVLCAVVLRLCGVWSASCMRWFKQSDGCFN